MFLFALHFATPVFAHDGEPRLEISADRLNPGAVLQVRGVDFNYDAEVAVALVDSTTGELIISLGTVVTDVEGVFIQNVILPTDLPEGIYTLRATTHDHEVFSPTFTVWGTAIIEDQESDVIRDQSDVQFEPVTALPPGMVPTAVSQATSPARPVSNWNQEIIISVLVIAGIFMGFGFRRMKKQ